MLYRYASAGFSLGRPKPSQPKNGANDLDAHTDTMAPNKRTTLLDVPESVLAEQVYGRLGVKDCASLSLACKRLRKVAIDGGVFSDKGRSWRVLVDTEYDGEDIISERINDKFFQAAQLFRPMSLVFKSEDHVQLFLERYAQLSPDDRWHIRTLWIQFGNPDISTRPLTTPLGTVLPRLQRLTLNMDANAPSGTQLDTQQILTGLTNCTQLSLKATTNWGQPEHAVQLHASAFSHMPHLSTLTLWGFDVVSVPHPPTAPTLSSLERLDILGIEGAQELLEHLAPHMPQLRTLSACTSPITTIPPGVFSLVGLESLRFTHCSNLCDIPEAITQLTNLTNLCVEFVDGGGVITLGPQIGLVTSLRALEIRGAGNKPLLPRTIERLTALTYLRLTFCRAGDEGFDLSCLHELRVLDVTYGDINIDNTTFAPGNFPHLRELTLTARGAIPQTAFRPGLLKLAVNGVSGPLPLTAEVAPMLNLTDLELTRYGHPDLPETLGLLSMLTSLHVRGIALERLPVSLSNLVNLEHLVISITRITTMPPLGALTNLKSLDIGSNYLTALPEGVTALPNLEAIKINWNDMRTLRWADLQMLPLCSFVGPAPRGRAMPPTTRATRSLWARSRWAARLAVTRRHSTRQWRCESVCTSV